MALGPDYDIATHFTPRYNPWDQRLCLVPDGDLFKAISEKRASVVTDEIDTFTENGIQLKDGSELEADIIVTATGLVLQVLGGMEVAVDGRAVDFARTLNYKGMMYSDVPNLASAFGYTNASWTLKCDLTCEYVCRLINYMDRHGYKQCMPHNVDPSITELPSLDFSSGYVQRSIAKMPKQGSKRPWRLYQNYALDIVTLRFGKVDDGVMTVFVDAGAEPYATPEIEKRPQTTVWGLDVSGLENPHPLFRLADRHLQGADAVDAAFDLVAGLELGDAGRRSRHDDVAGGERDLLRQLPDDLRHVPDQFGEVALLRFRCR